MNVADACLDFLTHCRVAKNLSPHTVRAYSIDLLEFERFAGPAAPVGAIDRPMLRRYLTHLFEARGLKETSVKRRLACLKVMFRWLELDEVIDVSPFHRLDARIRLPRRLPRNLSDDEVRRLRFAAFQQVGLSGKMTESQALAAAMQADFDNFTALVVLEILLGTGIRVGELAGTRLSDIDSLERVITILGKGSRQRRVFLPDDETAALVAAYHRLTTGRRRGHDHLIITTQGAPASTQHLRNLVRNTALAANLPRRITPHMLRHTAATRLLENGMDLRFVQRLLGHQSVSTTELYTTVTDASLKVAVVTATRRMKGGAKKDDN